MMALFCLIRQDYCLSSFFRRKRNVAKCLYSWREVLSSGPWPSISSVFTTASTLLLHHHRRLRFCCVQNTNPARKEKKRKNTQWEVHFRSQVMNGRLNSLPNNVWSMMKQNIFTNSQINTSSSCQSFLLKNLYNSINYSKVQPKPKLFNNTTVAFFQEE